MTKDKNRKIVVVTVVPDIKEKAIYGSFTQLKPESQLKTSDSLNKKPNISFAKPVLTVFVLQRMCKFVHPHDRLRNAKSVTSAISRAQEGHRDG